VHNLEWRGKSLSKQAAFSATVAIGLDPEAAALLA